MPDYQARRLRPYSCVTAFPLPERYPHRVRVKGEVNETLRRVTIRMEWNFMRGPLGQARLASPRLQHRLPTNAEAVLD